MRVMQLILNLEWPLDDQYYCTIILYNIIDDLFRQCETNASLINCEILNIDQ